jgi:hypothetical protein
MNIRLFFCEEGTRRCNSAIRPLMRCWILGFYRHWKLLLIILCISTLFCFMLTTDLPQENQTPTTLSILNTTIYRSNIIQGIKLYFHLIEILYFLFELVPRFLIFGVNANRRLTCKQMFEHVVPKIKASNITDKNLTELLFGTNSSSWYISYSDTNESIPMTQGKFCSNISNEWISLIVHQEGTIFFLIKRNFSIYFRTGNYKKQTCHENFVRYI